MASVFRRLLQRSAHSGPRSCEEALRKSIPTLLSEKDILLELAVEDKHALLEVVGEHMEAAHGLSRELVRRGLEQRERVGSTAIGQGVAIPHARVHGLDKIQVAYLRLAQPIDADAVDGKPVTDVFVLLVPKQAAQEHLVVLAEVSQLFADPHFRKQLQSCASAPEVLQSFAGALQGR
jgi:PTS system nitrogen regulatory IIA component